MLVTDPGHSYLLDTLDGDGSQVPLVFVKRCDPPETYPGNVGAHPGVTTQEVLRALIDRAAYVNSQIPDVANHAVTIHLKRAIWELEARAKRRRGEVLAKSVKAWQLPACPTCGHVDCTQHAPF